MKNLFLIWLLVAGGRQSTSGIELVVSTPRTVYHAGEKIPLTYYVVNRSNKGTFIYPLTPINLFFYDHFGGVGLEIIDSETGQPAKFKRILSHSGSGESLFTMPERSHKYYVYLSPGALTGRIDEFDTQAAELQVGNYELRLRFTDNEPEKWSEEDRLALPGLVFSGRVESNPLRITIVE